MVELLIYNQLHWMDLPSKGNPGMTGYERRDALIDTDSMLTTQQKIEKKLALTVKHNARFQPGDIVEARRDGRPRGKLEEESFAFLQIPITLKEAVGYTVSDMDSSNPPVLLHTRRFSIDMTGLVLDSHKSAALNESTFQSRLKVK